LIFPLALFFLDDIQPDLQSNHVHSVDAPLSSLFAQPRETDKVEAMGALPSTDTKNRIVNWVSGRLSQSHLGESRRAKRQSIQL
jgi:hypothetical protein